MIRVVAITLLMVLVLLVVMLVGFGEAEICVPYSFACTADARCRSSGLIALARTCRKDVKKFETLEIETVKGYRCYTGFESCLLESQRVRCAWSEPAADKRIVVAAPVAAVHSQHRNAGRAHLPSVTLLGNLLRPFRLDIFK